MKKVIGGTETGSNFPVPTEVERGEPLRIIGWQALRVEANAEVEGQTAAHRPSILKINGLRGLSGAAGIGHCSAADKEVAELATAESTAPERRSVLLNNRIAGRRTCERGILLPPLQVDHVFVRADVHLVGLS